MEKHTVSKMIGAPPGYIGFDSGGQLTEVVRRKPFSVILLDEVEKAHPDVFNALLQIMEDGRLTDSKGRTVDFKNTIIIMTSNVGSELLRRSEIGFSKNTAMTNDFGRRVRTILKEKFKPEFLNRIDEIVVFSSLSEEDIEEIIKLQIKKTQELLNEHNITINVDAKAQKYLLEKGFDPEYGARPLRRLIQRELENVLSSRMLSGDLSDGDTVNVSAKKDSLDIDVVSTISATVG